MECVQARPGASVDTKMLYQQYRAWSANEGYEPNEVLGDRLFGKEVAKQFRSVVRRQGKRDPAGQQTRPRIYDGLAYVGDTGLTLVAVPRRRQKPRRPEDLNLGEDTLPTAGFPLP